MRRNRKDRYTFDYRKKLLVAMHGENSIKYNGRKSFYLQCLGKTQSNIMGENLIKNETKIGDEEVTYRKYPSITEECERFDNHMRPKRSTRGCLRKWAMKAKRPVC